VVDLMESTMVKSPKMVEEDRDTELNASIYV
jgi:hypothetical protein